MNFNLDEAIEILQRTPEILEVFLTGLSSGWTESNEGVGTWNANEVIGHLRDCEKDNWMPRLLCILQEGEAKTFPAFDRFSHLKESNEKSVEQKLHEFKTIRMENVAKLKQMIDSEKHLELTGIHPEFGIVKLRELLSTWVVHDFTHITQIVRAMAEHYREDVGPWSAYLGILRRKQ